MITNLTTKQIESIQIDEGVIFLNYGETDERLLAPTRGGGEFAATVTVRDIEFDGRHGKTTGTQVIEEQGASLKVTTLCMSQENLALAIPTCTIAADDGKTIKTRLLALSERISTLKTLLCSLKQSAANIKKSRFTTLCTKRALMLRRCKSGGRARARVFGALQA